MSTPQILYKFYMFVHSLQGPHWSWKGWTLWYMLFWNPMSNMVQLILQKSEVFLILNWIHMNFNIRCSASWWATVENDRLSILLYHDKRTQLTYLPCVSSNCTIYIMGGCTRSLIYITTFAHKWALNIHFTQQIFYCLHKSIKHRE